jgi:hypothetical protein
VIILGVPATVSLARVAHVHVHLDGVEVDGESDADGSSVNATVTG